ncbi:MAG: hypothetical protein MUF57_02965 [Gammaproteobacteria bacterium]|nr:hypothetical protein [Gammaproteobacteria bacterium]
MPTAPGDPGGMGWPAPSMPSPDGAWEGSGGELLLIRKGMFRVYASSDSYRDGHLSIERGQLVLRDEESGQTHRYDMQFRADQLALRDPDGQVLEFRRTEEGGPGN